MKFDNAFLTINGKIGMQFRNKGELFSIYRDAKDEIHTTEGMRDDDHAKMVKSFLHLEKYYTK
jgi:hypothetical protein